MKRTAGRLSKELNQVLKSPPPFVAAMAPESEDLFQMHFVLAPGDGSPYAGGHFWGKFVFPKNYPAAPPALYFFTPSGRFETGKKICASFTDFHPESWQITWTLSTLLIGVMSFMLEEAPTQGSISESASRKRLQAARSHLFNASAPLFKRLFPQLVDEERGKKMLVAYQEEEKKQSLLMLGLIIGIMAMIVIYRLMQ